MQFFFPRRCQILPIHKGLPQLDGYSLSLVLKISILNSFVYRSVATVYAVSEVPTSFWYFSLSMNGSTRHSEGVTSFSLSVCLRVKKCEGSGHTDSKNYVMFRNMLLFPSSGTWGIYYKKTNRWGMPINYAFRKLNPFPYSGKLKNTRRFWYVTTPYSTVDLRSWHVHSLSRNSSNFFEDPKFHYRIHKRPPTVPILVHSSTSHFLKIHLNIILPNTPRSSKLSISVSLPIKKPLFTYSVHRKSHMPSIIVIIMFQDLPLFFLHLQENSWRFMRV